MVDKLKRDFGKIQSTESTNRDKIANLTRLIRLQQNFVQAQDEDLSQLKKALENTNTRLDHFLSHSTAGWSSYKKQNGVSEDPQNNLSRHIQAMQERLTRVEAISQDSIRQLTPPAISQNAEGIVYRSTQKLENENRVVNPLNQAINTIEYQFHELEECFRERKNSLDTDNQPKKTNRKEFGFDPPIIGSSYSQ